MPKNMEDSSEIVTRRPACNDNSGANRNTYVYSGFKTASKALCI